MENVILVIHLILALSLIGSVLLQRSEGGGLGMGGGGGGGGGIMSGRAAASAMGKITWVLAIAFIITSLTLTIVAAQKSSGASVLDRIIDTAPAAKNTEIVPSGDSLLPPTTETAPLTPPAAD